MNDERPDKSRLCLTLKKGESVDLGADIRVVYAGRKPGTSHATVCILAPRDVPIRRRKAEKPPLADDGAGS